MCCHEFFAGATLARHDDRRVARRHRFEQREQLAHSLAAAHDAGEPRPLVKRGLQVPDLAPALEFASECGQGRPQLGVVQRLGEKVMGAEFHRLDGFVDAAVRGDQDDRPVAVARLEQLQQREPAELRELNVGDHHVRALAFGEEPGLGPVACHHDMEAPLRQAHLEHFAHGGLVVHHEHLQASVGHLTSSLVTGKISLVPVHCNACRAARASFGSRVASGIMAKAGWRGGRIATAYSAREILPDSNR